MKNQENDVSDSRSPPETVKTIVNDDCKDTSSAVVSESDSPSPVKITGNKHDDDDEIKFGLSGLRSRLKMLSNEIREGFSILMSRLKILAVGMGERQNFNEQKLVKNEKELSFLLPSEIEEKLYPHQHEGLKWLWSIHLQGKGGILGDDMGLGKTLQICGFLAGLFHSSLTKRVLVVVPNTLISHWMTELGAVGLSEKTREYIRTCAKSQQSALQCILQDKGVLLTTYGTVCSNVESLSGLTWDYMILDEGHVIKNPGTQRAKSLLAIPCAHRIVLSGTPLQNNLRELWALFNFISPEILCGKKCFNYGFEKPILRGNDKNASDTEKRIGSAVAQDLRKCIQPYFLRRLKDELLRDDDGTNMVKLSKKNELIVWLKLSSCQRRLYEAFLNQKIFLLAVNTFPLTAISILKKICDHPLLLTKRAAKDVLVEMKSALNQEPRGIAEKLAMNIANVADRYDIGENQDILSCKISFIASLLDNLISEGHNVLIFSQTLKMLDLIQDTLNARGYKFLRIDGTTKDSDRLKIVNDFQEGGTPIFLLTSKVGGLGLTLTKADRVIIVDPDWNPSIDNQSVDRAYCIGQKKDVIVYRLISCGTIEEKIYRKQIFKGGLCKTATDHEDHIRYFSQQDLRELFRIPGEQQLNKEHDCEHKMDSYLKVHTKFLESLGIAGISNHGLLFSKAASAPVVPDKELPRWIRKSSYRGYTSSPSSNEQHNVYAYAFSESRVNANKAMVARLADNGEKIRKQIGEPKKLPRPKQCIGGKNIGLKGTDKST